MGCYYAPGKSDTKYVSSSFLSSGKTSFYLMHKDIKVAEFTMTKSGMAVNVLEVFEPKHMPVGTRGFKQPMLNQRFVAWKNSRCVPSERPDYNKVAEVTGLMYKEIETINMGVSLNDCYWFKPINTSYTWSDVNFYDNKYANDIGNIVINDIVAADINLKTPDATTNGVLPKMWLRMNGKNHLLKVGESRTNQEVCNEVFASLVAERLGLDTVTYVLSRLQDGKACALCENFIQDNNTEFVSMQQISVEQETIGRSGVLQFIEDNGLKEDVQKLLVLDYLIANQDRHLGNLGFLRDANTLEIVSLSPMFDYDKSMNIGFWGSDARNDIAKPFAYTHAEQIKLVSDMQWLDLTDVKEHFKNDIAIIYEQGGFSPQQILNIQSFFEERVRGLELVLESLKAEKLDDKISHVDNWTPIELKEEYKKFDDKDNDKGENLDAIDLIEWEQS